MLEFPKVGKLPCNLWTPVSKRSGNLCQYQNLRFLLTNKNCISMLNSIIAEELHVDSPIYSFQQKAQFSRQDALWEKRELPPTITLGEQVSPMYEYYKHGKTLGLETKRFVVIRENYLLYYINKNDSKATGYCNLENVYAYFLHTTEGKHLLYLTNGKESSKFYFDNPEFLNLVQHHCKSNIIQLNFNQKYTPIDFLGQGSFSKVFLSRRNEDQKLFANKVISKIDKNGYPTFKCVVDEKKVMTRLSGCEYIYKFEQFYEQAGNYNFVIEYLTGSDLMTLLKNKETDFTFDQKIGILKNILEALVICHERNVIHRDLKPQNIIIEVYKEVMKPKLIDFGLSLIVSPANELSDFKRCGTMGYMAPEVVENSSTKRKAYDYKCDVFSFGIIAHMVLMGFNPLKGKNYQETYLKNKQCNLQLNKEEIIKKCDQDCYNLLSKCLQRNPKLRPSAESVLKLNLFKNKESSQSTIDKSGHLSLKRTDSKFQQEQLAMQSLGLIQKEFSKLKLKK